MVVKNLLLRHHFAAYWPILGRVIWRLTVGNGFNLLLSKRLIRLRDVLLFLVLGHMNDVSVAAWTLLPLNEPFFKAFSVKDVVTDWNLHKFFSLYKVLQTHAALLLLSHVLNISCILMAIFVVGVGRVINLLHRSVVNADHCLNLSWVFLVFVLELVKVSFLLFIPIILLRQVEAYDFERDNKKENKN